MVWLTTESMCKAWAKVHLPFKAVMKMPEPVTVEQSF